MWKLLNGKGNIWLKDKREQRHWLLEASTYTLDTETEMKGGEVLQT